MIAIIRIHGRVGVNKDIEDTLNRLNLKRKYNCVIISEEKKEIIGMLKKVRNFVAYGKITEETLKELKKERGDKIGKVFRLHPPRGGIKSKLHYPKGVLGDNQEGINKLIMRML